MDVSVFTDEMFKTFQKKVKDSSEKMFEAPKSSRDGHSKDTVNQSPGQEFSYDD